MRKYLIDFIPAVFSNPFITRTSRSVTVTEGKVFSYQTCVAFIDNEKNTLFIDKNKYSMTTSTLQNALREEAKYRGMHIVEVDECETPIRYSLKAVPMA